MDRVGRTDITELLMAWSAGDAAALDSLIPFVEAELRRMAKAALGRERAGHTLETTALINEAYIKLIGAGANISWHDRAHFFAVCARIMRQILVDYARSRRAAKHGGGAAHLPLDEALALPADPAGLVAIDDALRALSGLDSRKGRVVELRFYGGLSVEETASVLNVSPDTVIRDWRVAKAWLMRELSGRSAAPN